MIAVELSPEAIILLGLHIAIAIVSDGFAEGNGKIGIVGTCPAIGNAIAGDESVVFHSQGRPQHFPVVVIDAVEQVENHTLLLGSLGKDILVDADTLRGGEAAAHAIIGECHLIIARRCLLCIMREALSIATVGVVFCAGVEHQRSRLGHQHDVAQVRMTCSAEMGVREANDGIVGVLIAGTVLIDLPLIAPVNVLGNGVSLR